MTSSIKKVLVGVAATALLISPLFAMADEDKTPPPPYDIATNLDMVSGVKTALKEILFDPPAATGNSQAALNELLKKIKGWLIDMKNNIGKAEKAAKDAGNAKDKNKKQSYIEREMTLLKAAQEDQRRINEACEDLKKRIGGEDKENGGAYTACDALENSLNSAGIGGTIADKVSRGVALVPSSGDKKKVASKSKGAAVAVLNEIGNVVCQSTTPAKAVKAGSKGSVIFVTFGKDADLRCNEMADKLASVVCAPASP